jgi:hypothetical protein
MITKSTYVNFLLSYSFTRQNSGAGKHRPPVFRTLLATLLLFLLNFQASAQCNGAPDMVFQTPVLISGTDGVPGAVYRFSNVCTGVDATIEIMSLNGGALLGEIDNTTQGYYDAWQPYVTAGANDTSFLEWKITFLKAGTNTDTVMPCVAITAVDCDGDNANLKEFIQAATPGAYAVSTPTTLSISYDGVYNKAIGSIVTIPLIDTAHREAMFQMNFQNISQVIYRNGSISTKNTIDVRHTCIYFKPFFYNSFIILPVKLVSLQAKEISHQTVISWSVMDEQNMSHYTVQKSTDGIAWTSIDQVSAINSTLTHTYYSNDAAVSAGVTYYRLQQTDQLNRSSYSPVIHIGNNKAGELAINCATVINKKMSIQVNASTIDDYTIRIHSLQGQLLSQQKYTVPAGFSNMTVALPLSSATGMYVVTITNKQGRRVYSSKVLSQ